MKFIYLDEQGNQVGPVDESVIVQGIRAGKLTPETAIRNALLRDFRTLAEFDCFAEELALTAPQQTEEDKEQFGLSDLAYIRHIARKQVQEEQNATIAAKLYAGDAKVVRRLSAMLLDMVILLPVLAMIFIPAITSFPSCGTQDAAELERQKKAKELQLFLDRQQEEAAATDEDQEEAAPPEKPRKAQEHDTNQALVNRMLPGVLNKLPNAYMPGRTQLQKKELDSQNVSQPQQRTSGSTTKKASAVKKTRSSQGAAGQAASKPVKKAAKSLKKTAAAYQILADEERPKVLLANMPGGKLISRYLPSVVQQWEGYFYADGIKHSADEKTLLGQIVRSRFVITGCARVEDGILLRTGNNILKFTDADLSKHFSKPLKWAALVLLLYYTLALSIFAQTLGMWFWGIFLTRIQLAEVLPLRALLYTMTMLLFGILMIPAVLITGRSVADWICGVRQVGVGSVSKAS